VWIVLLAILGVIAVGLGGAVLGTAPGRKEIMDLTIANLDFKTLRDGAYVGEYKGTKDSTRNTKVQVTVEAGKVSDIDLLEGPSYKNGQPVKLTGGLTIDDLSQKVIDAQSLQVDVISGATLNSKTHLKAVENALAQAQGK
jgi:uncharacterized protein with FMN-binding domain